MRVSRWVLIILLVCSARASALETDQFTPPARPLADLGATVDAKIYADLQACVDDANARRAAALAQLPKAWTPRGRREAIERADAAVSPEALADALYDRLATGEVPRCKIEKWLEDKDSGRSAKLQNTGIRDSVYGGPFERPPLIVEVSPTVNLYGQYVGVDKVGHFMQQGHEYFNSYRTVVTKGGSNEKAIAAAVDHGVGQEHGFYGEITVGVYSNADLAANLCGMLFYRNLMETVRVGNQTIEPMLAWEGQKLVLTQRAKDGPTKPFITEHWSEAMNPCRYAYIWRRPIRNHVAQRLNAWYAFYHTTPELERERLERVQTFFGTPYGHLGDDSSLVTVVNAGPGPHDPITASMHE
jgi:hypothetical protein